MYSKLPLLAVFTTLTLLITACGSPEVKVNLANLEKKGNPQEKQKPKAIAKTHKTSTHSSKKYTTEKQQVKKTTKKNETDYRPQNSNDQKTNIKSSISFIQFLLTNSSLEKLKNAKTSTESQKALKYYLIAKLSKAERKLYKKKLLKLAKKSKFALFLAYRLVQKNSKAFLNAISLLSSNPTDEIEQFALFIFFKRIGDVELANKIFKLWPEKLTKVVPSSYLLSKSDSVLLTPRVIKVADIPYQIPNRLWTFSIDPVSQEVVLVRKNSLYQAVVSIEDGMFIPQPSFVKISEVVKYITPTTEVQECDLLATGCILKGNWKSSKEVWILDSSTEVAMLKISQKDKTFFQNQAFNQITSKFGDTWLVSKDMKLAITKNSLYTFSVILKKGNMENVINKIQIISTER